MTRYVTAGVLAISVIAVAGVVQAQPPLQSAELDAPGASATLQLPAEAGNGHVISLGEAVDPETGRVVEGFAFVHPSPKTGFHHRDDHDGGPPGGGGNDNGGSSCFAFIDKHTKWKTVEPWIVNAANTEGLSESFVFDTLTASITDWEDAADGAVDDVQGADILGDGSTTDAVLVADTESPDGDNEVYFGDVSSDGAIAVTIVWGIFRGPPGQRELVEWDQIYDQVDFDWSATGEEGKMDFHNIAAHELGHSTGMGHPDDSCIEETMYRFAEDGETKKRTLHTGDIAGMDELY